MRPALLILMMDFLVASLLLYVTDTKGITQGLTNSSIPAVVINESESILTDVFEMEKKWDEEAEKYYTELFIQNSDEKNRLMREENNRLSASLQIRHSELDQTAKELQSTKEIVTQQKIMIEEKNTENDNINKIVSEKDQTIVNNQQMIAEKDQVIVSMQDMTQKAVNETIHVNRLLKEKSDDVEKKSAQILDTEKKLSEQTQKFFEAYNLKNNLEQQLAEETNKREELSEIAAQKEKELSKVEAEKQKAIEQFNEKITDLENIKHQLDEKERLLVEHTQKVSEMEYVKKQLEQELQLEKTQRAELLEKTKDMVDKLQKDESERFSTTLTKLDDLQKSQNSTMLAIKEFETKIDQLPDKFREATRTIIDENQNIIEKNDILREQIQTLVASIDPEASKQIINEMQSLKENNKNIEQHLQNLMKGGSSEETITQIMSNLDEDNRKIREKQAEIDTSAASVLSKNKGIFSIVTDARVEIKGNLKEKGRFWGENEYKVQTYPINIKHDGKVYAITHSSTLGLDWSGITDRLTTSNYSIKMTPTNSSFLSEAQSMNNSCKIVFIPNSGGDEPLALYQSLSEIRSKALGNLHIFKHSMKTSNLKVTEDVTFIEEKRWIIFNYAFLTFSNKPEKGDFVVTNDGHLVGVMKDQKTCMVITTNNLDYQGTMISFSSPRSLLISVRSYTNYCTD